MEVRIRVYRGEKYLCAEGMDADIFTQGKNLEELMHNIIEAIECYYDVSIKDVTIITEYKAGTFAETASC
ncbi:HicB family protein [Methanocella sp. CWC-04]|uniref:HicB family protein n=1 Tax=Methanooceanicella nereidis TaxID=2052831 RepID=A0AAP2W5W5_9EURY|nr:hypothetical protein [Methanocella sp. CWC-04]MCD1296010.1 HicB family protein [Methanocella sp. CWC-04]